MSESQSTSHLTEEQQAYFATIRRLDPSPKMERAVRSAIASLDPARPGRAARRGFWRGVLRGLGWRR